MDKKAQEQLVEIAAFLLTTRKDEEDDALIAEIYAAIEKDYQFDPNMEDYEAFMDEIETAKLWRPDGN